jgi:hypothetical protein
MISIVLPIKSINRVREALEVLAAQKINLENEINELRAAENKKISYNEILIAQLTSILDSINKAIDHLIDLNSDINEDFAVLADIQSSISASQPYNAGSRENY